MNAERLREAAKAIRADNQPWHDDACGCDDPACEHIAFMTAVASWLDAEAGSLDAMAVLTRVAADVEYEANISGAAITVHKGANGGVSLRADTSAPALAVANAYLGGAA